MDHDHITIARLHGDGPTLHPIRTPEPPTLPAGILVQPPEVLHDKSTLYRQLCQRHPPEVVDSMIAAMHVTYSRYRDGSAVFYLIDPDGGVRDGHVVPFDAAGRRDGRHYPTWVHLLTDAPAGYIHRPVVFGAHLLPRYPDATVEVVEHEEEALEANIARGGILGATLTVATALPPEGLARRPDAYSPLRGRHVRLVPDTSNVAAMLALARALTPVTASLTVAIPQWGGELAVATRA